MSNTHAAALHLLDNVKLRLLERSNSEDFSGLTGDEWEELVFQVCQQVNESQKLQLEIYRTKNAEFPDIVIGKTFGVEVKATTNDYWTTLGNSINESRRIQTVNEVYFFFGKLGGDFDIKYKAYSACLKSIATTHYPRYVVDMGLAEGESIFDKLGLSYDQYRLMDGDARIRIIKDYLRSTFSEGEALWWIDDTTPPSIKNFNRFSQDAKKQFTVEAMVKCPEVFMGGRSKGKYDRVAQLLITEHQAVSGNLRDHFSASGKQKIVLSNGIKLEVPQIVFQLHANAIQIRHLILSTPVEELSLHWEKYLGKPLKDPVKTFAQILDAIGEFRSGNVGTGSVFIDGLGLL